MSRTAALRELALATPRTRLGALLNLLPFVSTPEWWSTLGTSWVDCENLRDYLDILRPLLRHGIAHGWHRRMMAPGELRRLAALPAEIVVYRGCGEHNQNGLRWTLDRDAARRCALRERGAPLLITGTVPREFVVLKDKHGEVEIVTPLVLPMLVEVLHAQAELSAEGAH